MAADDVKYTGQEQLVKTRYFRRDTDQEPMFSGLVPKEYARDRAKGLRWLELKAAAEEEAAARKLEEAAKAAEAPAEPDPAVQALMAEVEALRAELQALRELQESFRAATPEVVLENSGQIARVANLAADLEAQHNAQRKEIEGWLAECRNAQSQLQTLLAELAAQAGALVADVRSQVATMLAESARKLATAIARRITGFELRAADLRGPKGNTGAPGMSTATVPGDPRKLSEKVLLDRFRRPLIPGDQADQQTREGFLRWVWNGETWEQAALIPVDVRVESRPLSILDQSTKVNSPITIVRGGSGGGSGGESLLNNRILLSTPTFIGDTSNHGGEDIRSGEFELEIRALDGTLAGYTLSLITAFNYDGGVAGPSFTEYALEGSLKDVFEIELSMSLVAASVPPGVTATMPGGAQALRTSATVRPIPGVSGTGGVTRFALRGSVEYNREAVGKAYGPNEAMPSLLWHWG